MTHQRNISAYILRLTISVALLMSSTCAIAQGSSSKAKQAHVEKNDTTPLFKGFAVSFDLVGAIQKMVSDYGQYEASLRINLKDKYFPVFELGYGMSEHDDAVTNNYYKANAPYARIGVDFNILKNKHDIYKMFAGFRLAATSFKYDLYHPDITDPVWGGSSTYSATGVKCSYTWIEAVIGIDAKIWGPFHLGWTARYRSRMSADEGDYGNCWYVPGFGKRGKTNLGGTFNVTINI